MNANKNKRTVHVRRVDECHTLDELFRHCLPAFGGAFLRRIYTILDEAIGRCCPVTLSIAGPVTVSARAGEEGKLFGSVTAADIAAAVGEQARVDVDRKDVHLDEPIRSVGTHEVRVHLFADVDPVITVEVVAAE